jgi:hypothetical protein
MRLGVIIYSQTVAEASARRPRKASILVLVVKRSAWLRKTATNTPRCQNASPRCLIAPNDYWYLACGPVLKRYYGCVVGFIGHLKIPGKVAPK